MGEINDIVRWRTSGLSLGAAIEEVDHRLYALCVDPVRDVGQHRNLTVGQAAVGGDALLDGAERVAVAQEDQRWRGDCAEVVDRVARRACDAVECLAQHILPVPVALLASARTAHGSTRLVASG